MGDEAGSFGMKCRSFHVEVEFTAGSGGEDYFCASEEGALHYNLDKSVAQCGRRNVALGVRWGHEVRFDVRIYGRLN